jgi:ABC-type lipoprotein release transport system permease subunit
MLRRFVFEVSALDPLTFVVIPLCLCAVALAACYVPARRASRVEPLVAMRAP